MGRHAACREHIMSRCTVRQTRQAQAHKARQPWQVVTRPAEIKHERKEQQAREKQSRDGHGVRFGVPQHPQDHTEREEHMEKRRKEFHQHVSEGEAWSVWADVSEVKLATVPVICGSEAGRVMSVVEKVAQGKRCDEARTNPAGPNRRVAWSDAASRR